MTFISKYYDFCHINEKLGILFSLEDIANDIVDHLNKSDYYKLEKNYLGKDITIHCYKIKNLDNEAEFSVINDDNLEFKIKTTGNNLSQIVHELKHNDYYLRGQREDKFFKMRHAGRYVSKNLKHLINFFSVLDMVFYLINKDEFQAQYHSMYYDLKDKIDDNMSVEEKRKIIDNYLNEQKIYLLYNIFNQTQFDIKTFFKSNSDLNNWIDNLKKRMQYIDEEGDRYYFKKKEIYLSKVRFIINKVVGRNSSLSEDNNKLIKKLNYMINKQVKDSFKKFSRLYSLFI